MLVLSSLSVGFSAQSTSSQDDTNIFDLTLMVPASGSQGRIEWAEMINTEFNNIGINSTLIQMSLNPEIISRVLNSSIDITPTFDNGGFDALFLDLNFEWSKFELFRELFSRYSYDSAEIDNPTTFFSNFINYNNPQMDQLIANYFSEFDHVKRLEIVDSISNLLYTDVASLPLLNIFEITSSYSNIPNIDAIVELLTGDHSIKDWSWLNEFGKRDLNFGWVLDYGYRTVPFLPYAYEFLPTFVFQGLFHRDPTNLDLWVPVIAQSLPEFNEDYSVATVHLRDDVTFYDGHTLDAEDVVESYKWYLNYTYWPPSLSIYPDLQPHFTTNSIVALDDNTVEFRFNAPTIFNMELMRRAILPIHHYGTIEHPKFNTSADFVGNLVGIGVSENGTSPFAYGTGPFTFSNLTGQSIELIANPNYWGGEFNVDSISFKKDYILSCLRDCYPLTPYLINDLKSGEIDFIVASMLNQSAFDEEPDLYSWTTNMDTVLTLEINHAHPVYGTGVGTPIGMGDSSKALEAARNVRRAMSHAIPREKISERFFGGTAGPLSVDLLYSIVGFDPAKYPAAEYDLEKSRHYLKEAGYFEGPDSNGDAFLSFPIDLWLMVVPILIISAVWISRRRKFNSPF